MKPVHHHLTIGFRLSTAIAVLFLVTLIISAISLWQLRSAESWLDTIHRETLAEVSSALELSAGAANLATTAPFLLTVQLPFQLQVEADEIVSTIANLETMAKTQSNLTLPLARLRDAISDLIRLSLPQRALEADITQIDLALARLERQFTRAGNSSDFNVEDRLVWAKLRQLTSNAQDIARAQALIDVSEYSRVFVNNREALMFSAPALILTGLAEIDAVLISKSTHLFVLKHQALTAALDAESALFRIRQLSDIVTSYAAQKVVDAEGRLNVARTQTSQNLIVAQSAVATLTLLSSIVAAVSALFVSRYVVGNLRRIADAMHRLAAGDHTNDLPRNTHSRDEIGQLFDAFGIFRENAQKLERRTAEIRRQNALFSSVFRNIKDGVAILSRSGKIEAENEKVHELLRLPSNSTTSDITMRDRIALSEFSRQTSGADRAGFEEYENAAGNVLEVRQSQLPDGRSVWLLSETTERKRIDERLEEIRRVETLGKVTGEVAHDFGNILSTISGNLHLLETATQTTAPAHLNRIRTAVDVGVSLTERLVAFARKQHLEPEVIEISALVEGLIDLLSIALPENVTLDLELRDAPIFVRLDPGQLESAILNLCVNAGQAIDGAGKISIILDCETEQQVRLSVLDDGSGMSAETKSRAFEPFYSNRPGGEGTGLGLSMVYGFVNQSGGSLTVESALGSGTEVSMRFPIHQLDVDAPSTPKFGGVALVVDDTQATAVAVTASLAAIGFTVLTATSFAKAQKIILKTPHLALIVTDLNLDHGQTGIKLIEQTLKLNDATLAILMSSRLLEGFIFEDKFGFRCAMLEKPINSLEMSKTISSLYDAVSEA
jgi:signal transduction histidine kinase/HAMP domain-containing protein/CheY-like chemotaxis protein